VARRGTTPNKLRTNNTLKAQSASFQTQLAEAAKALADLDVTVKRLGGELAQAKARVQELIANFNKLNDSLRKFTVARNQSENLGEGHYVGVVDSDGNDRQSQSFL
jgi:chromosome segregation ATPase